VKASKYNLSEDGILFPSSLGFYKNFDVLVQYQVVLMLCAVNSGACISFGTENKNSVSLDNAALVHGIATVSSFTGRTVSTVLGTVKTIVYTSGSTALASLTACGGQ